MSRIRWSPWALIAVLVGLVALGLAGSALPAHNGDHAVYLWQARTGNLGERTIHVGWIAAVALVGRWLGVARAAGLLHGLAAAVACFATWRLSERRGDGRIEVALFSAVLLLPIAPFAETDLPAAACVLAARVAPWPVAALLLGAGLTVSPLVVLFLPWWWVDGGDRKALVGVALAALALLIGTGGEVATGDRGWLHSGGNTPFATFVTLAMGLPWALVAARIVGAAPPARAPESLATGVLTRPTAALSFLALWFAPPDLAISVVPAALLVARIGLPRGGALFGALALQVALSGGLLWRTLDRVGGEQRAIEAYVAGRGPRDGLVAPWSMGVRASLLATGAPYKLPWRPPGPFVRAEQEGRWCATAPRRVGWLPAGAGPADATALDGGVRWTEGAGVAPMGLPGCPPSGDKPNVVLILGCTLRKDVLSPWGGDAVTPHLSRLADEGAIFEDLVAAAPWTRPASLAILSGRHAIDVGMIEPGFGPDEKVLPESVSLLAERFEEAGWTTVGLTANPNLNPEFGLAQGLSHFEGAHPWKDRPAKVRGAKLVPGLLDRLDAAKADGPVFLQVMFADAHSPWPKVIRPPQGQSAEQAGYRLAVGQLDEAVGALLDGLLDRGMGPANTLVVWVGDHGEAIREAEAHGKGHGRHFWPTVVEVPWGMAGAGVPARRRVPGLASQIDVAPTVLGWVGLPHEDLPGLDLSVAIREGSPTGRQRAISDSWFHEVSRAAVFSPNRSCQQDWSTWPLHPPAAGFVDGCFERSDRFYQRPFDDEALQAELFSWRDAAWARYEGLDALERAGATSDTARLLEALGYVEGGAGSPDGTDAGE